jgi:uroporphyrinogen decarboxylase
MGSMTSRERVWRALNHEEPDKVPLDLNGTCCTALTGAAYSSLRDYLGLPPDPKPSISSQVMISVRARDDLLLRYEIDTRTVHLRAPLASKGRALPDRSFYDEYGIRWRPASFYYDAVEYPLAHATTNDLATAVWPDPYDPGRVAGLREEARRLYEATSYCLVADMPAFGPFEGSCLVRGYEQFCVDLFTDPMFADALLDRFTELAIAFYEVLLREVGPYVQVVALGDDVGMQTGPFISPALYRRFVKPRHKRIFDYIHAHTTAKILYHSCGSVYDLIPDFIEAGVDILNPVQRSAARMDLRRLKCEFGDEICFWGGGIDIQSQLPFYTLSQIEDEVTRTLEIMSVGGGYVFFPTHNIQADVTPDRIDCMFRAVLSHRDRTGVSDTSPDAGS